MTHKELSPSQLSLLREESGVAPADCEDLDELVLRGFATEIRSVTGSRIWRATAKGIRSMGASYLIH